MKKTFVILMLIIPFLLAACSKEESVITNLNEMELSGGQTLVTGQVTSRVGNDIELALGTISETQFPGGTGAMPSGEKGAMPSGGRGSMPSGDRGAMPSGGPAGNGTDNTSGGISAVGNTFSEDAAQGTAASDGSLENSAAAQAQIQLSGETMSLTIPVGTKVLVTSGGALSASSFGRIQTDDILQLIIKTDADGSQTVIMAQIME